MQKEKKKSKKSLTYQMPQLTMRYMIILQVINDYVCVRSWDVAVLAGVGSISYMNRLLLQFCRCGWLISDYYGGEKIYTITAKGRAAIGLEGPTWTFNAMTTHYLYTARVAACWFARNPRAIYQSILTDRNLKIYLGRQNELNPQMVFTHRPDLVINGTAYEIEISFKKLDRVRENMQANAVMFPFQVWIYPEQIPTIGANIRRCVNELGLKDRSNVFTYEKCTNETAKFDLKALAAEINSRSEGEVWHLDPSRIPKKQEETKKKLDKYRQLPAAPQREGANRHDYATI